MAQVISSADHAGRLQGRGWARTTYSVLAWVLVACLIAQVYLAGMAIFVFPTYWAMHTTFVHVFEGIPLLMLIVAWVGGLRRRLRWLPLAAIGLVFAQYATANMRTAPGLELLSAAHPVIAILFVWSAVEIARQSHRTT